MDFHYLCNYRGLCLGALIAGYLQKQSSMNVLQDILSDSTRRKLIRLKRKHAIDQLYVFGSAARGDFDPKRSDLDFLVVFDEDKIPLLSYADNLFDLMDSLKRIFNRDIDLLTPRSLKNPYFADHLNKSKVRVL